MAIDHQTLNQLFLEARSHSFFLDQPVSDQLLSQLYELVKMGPTSVNSCPMRLIFVRSKEGREKLSGCVSAGNEEKVLSAPVTAIVAQDTLFYEKLPFLFPPAPAKSWFEGNEALIEETYLRNTAMQGGYLIIAARALGLDCGPISGFDHQKVDTTFLADTSYKSNFLCNLGYGDKSQLHPRLPRLSLEAACQFV